MSHARLILASQSPRRAALLNQIGQPFEVRLPTQDAEPPPETDETPADYALRMAQRKAADVQRMLSSHERDAWVLAADTIVVLADEILGKPADAAEAEAMLTRLSGRSHEVITAFALYHQEAQYTEAVETKVWFRPLSMKKIRCYIASGEPMDKAGAYGIQGRAAAFIERISGCYFNVVGLPLSHVVAALERQATQERQELTR